MVVTVFCHVRVVAASELSQYVSSLGGRGRYRSCPAAAALAAAAVAAATVAAAAAVWQWRRLDDDIASRSVVCFHRRLSQPAAGCF